MSWVEIIADRKIRDAQEEGVFDNLPGKGKPLNLDFDPRVPPEQRAAYRLMKEARLLPDWIELEKEIRQRRERLEEGVESFARRREEAVAALGPKARREDEELLDRRREALLVHVAREYRELNALIDRFNLMVPVRSRQRVRFRLQEQLELLEERFPRFHPRPAVEARPWEAFLDESRPPTQLSNRMPLRRKRGSIG
jgi:hypothetical protein